MPREGQESAIPWREPPNTTDPLEVLDLHEGLDAMMGCLEKDSVQTYEIARSWKSTICRSPSGSDLNAQRQRSARRKAETVICPSWFTSCPSQKRRDRRVDIPRSARSELAKTEWAEGFF